MNTEEESERKEAERLTRALSGKLHRGAPAKKWSDATTTKPANTAELQKARSANNVNEPQERHPAATPVHHEAPVIHHDPVIHHEPAPAKDIMADGTKRTNNNNEGFLSRQIISIFQQLEKESKKQAEEEEARMAKFMNKRGLGNLVK